MHLAGYPLSALLGIFGAAAACTVVLYILKLRRRPVAVAFSPIWQRVLGARESSRLFSQLKRWLSLLLQLALLALLALALGDPRFVARSSEARHLVVLLDGSASMLAGDVPSGRLGAAKAAVAQLIAGLGPSDSMLLAQMDAGVTPLTTMTDDAAELGAALERVRATDTRADLGRALAFALDATSGRSRPEIIVVSDGAFGDEARRHAPALGDTPLTFLPVGKSGHNVAITGFSVRRYPLDRSRYEVMLEVLNTNDAPADVELSLLGDGQVAETTRLSLGPGERRAQFYANLAGADRTLEATLSAPAGLDDLARDDHAYALMPERHRTRVLVVTAGNTYLEAALLLDEFLEVTRATPDAPLPPGRFDVTILDGVAVPAEQRLGGLLYLNPPAAGGPVELGRTIEDFGFDRWDEKSPILRWTAPENVQVRSGHALVPQARDQVLGASEQGPILVSGRRGNQAFVALGFDPRQSDLVLRVTWPLFLLNTINHFVEEDTGYVSSFRTGDVWQIPVAGDVQLAWLTEPDGTRSRLAVKEGKATHLGLHAGFYELTPDGEGHAPLRFAANLADPDESRIAPQTTLELGGTKAGEAHGFEARARHQIWGYLVIAVLLLSAVEWFTYHRRITV
ncbi:MAG TPA: VWA domain-containing protein [Polyangiaceae bacterium]|nr:VWA domain-containing protein [Polyangiaceae bacterium]